MDYICYVSAGVGVDVARERVCGHQRVHHGQTEAQAGGAGGRQRGGRQDGHQEEGQEQGGGGRRINVSYGGHRESGGRGIFCISGIHMAHAEA